MRLSHDYDPLVLEAISANRAVVGEPHRRNVFQF